MSGPTPIATAAIEARGLTKDFGRVQALRGLDLEVPPGSVFGFLGPNGAGKTTALSILVGEERPTRILRAVVLPAPLGPRKPKTLPGGTSRSRPRRACTRPKSFVRPRASIAAVAMGVGPDMIRSSVSSS